MKKTDIQAGGETQHSFFKVKTHSIADILAAGGATGLAAKMGKKSNTKKRPAPRKPQTVKANAQPRKGWDAAFRKYIKKYGPIRLTKEDREWLDMPGPELEDFPWPD